MRSHLLKVRHSRREPVRLVPPKTPVCLVYISRVAGGHLEVPLETGASVGLPAAINAPRHNEAGLGYPSDDGYTRWVRVLEGYSMGNCSSPRKSFLIRSLTDAPVTALDLPSSIRTSCPLSTELPVSRSEKKKRRRGTRSGNRRRRNSCQVKYALSESRPNLNSHPSAPCSLHLQPQKQPPPCPYVGRLLLDSL